MIKLAWHSTFKNKDNGIWSHHFMANRWETMETVTDFIFLGSKITADGDCSCEIDRRLLLGRKPMTNLSSVQLFSRVWLFVTPWIAARQASLSITNSLSPLNPMSIESVMPSNHLILCRPLIPPSIRVFFNESTLCMRWPKYWSFSFSISPSNEHPGLISFRMDWSPWISLQSTGLSRIFSNTIVQNHQFFGTQLSSQSNSHIHTWPLEKP